MDNLAINYDEIGNMKAAIESYIKEVDAHMTTIRGFAIDASSGIYGSQTQTIDTYIDSVCNEITSIVTRFQVFEDGLDKIKANYEAMGKNVKTAEVADAKEMADEDIIDVKPFSN